MLAPSANLSVCRLEPELLDGFTQDCVLHQALDECVQLLFVLETVQVLIYQSAEYANRL